MAVCMAAPSRPPTMMKQSVLNGHEPWEGFRKLAQEQPSTPRARVTPPESELEMTVTVDPRPNRTSRDRPAGLLI